MRYALLMLLALSVLSGCGTGYRACASWSGISIRSPVFVAGDTTNSLPSNARATTQIPYVSIPNNGAPIMLYAEQVMVLVGGGSASSNSVLSGISVPVVP